MTLEFLRSLLPPKQFAVLVVAVGAISAIYPLVIKLDRVIENQIKARERDKVIEQKLYQLNSEIGYLQGQNRDKNRALEAISNQAVQNSIYINSMDRGG